jgi:hypothetical protein
VGYPARICLPDLPYRKIRCAAACGGLFRARPARLKDKLPCKAVAGFTDGGAGADCDAPE